MKQRTKSRIAPMALPVLLALGSSCLPAVANAEIYGYLDSDGSFTYTNIPPPANARVTDVIHEDPPVPAKVAAEAARQSEINALNDRIRLLELENSRAKHVTVDYPAQPVAPAGVGCGPNGQYECSDDYGPYYTTGLLYPVGVRYRGNRDWHGHRGPAPQGGTHATIARSGASSAHGAVR
jgi:hypothetical protein